MSGSLEGKLEGPSICTNPGGVSLHNLMKQWMQVVHNEEVNQEEIQFCWDWESHDDKQHNNKRPFRDINK